MRTEAVSKGYGKTLAVREASVSIFAGEVLGVVGGNGSGKSTLAGLLSGGLAPDGGRIIFHEQPVVFQHPSDAIRRGISMLSQFPELFPGLDPTENIYMGQEPFRRRPMFRILDRHTMTERATALLGRVGASDIPLTQPVGNLSCGQQKAVAMARVLARDADVVIFDEPNASLGLRQRENTLKIISDYRTENKAAVLITHDLEEVMSTCDRVIVMSRGEVIADRPLRDLTRQSLSEFIVRS
jgi:simple sugar transport system ATP-binding protein